MFGVQCSVFSVPGSVFSVQCSVFSVQGSVFGVQCSVFRVQGSIFRVQYSSQYASQNYLYFYLASIIMTIDPPIDSLHVSIN